MINYCTFSLSDYREQMKTTLETRRANLRVLVAQWGGPSSLATKLGYKGPSYNSVFAPLKARVRGLFICQSFSTFRVALDRLI